MRQLVDPVGEVLLAQTYDPYGSLYASAGVDSTAFGYAGEQEDTNGLVFLRARYYSPSMGRFLNMDPSRQEMNPYQYSLNNPILFTDPSGLIPPECLADPYGELCRQAVNGGSSGGGATVATEVIHINIEVDEIFLLWLLTGACPTDLSNVAFGLGALEQFVWDETQILRAALPSSSQPEPGMIAFPVLVLFTINDFNPEQFSQAEADLLIRLLTRGLSITQSDMDQAYWNGSQDYRDGRDFGRSLSWAFSVVEFAVGVSGNMAASGSIGTTLGATAASCLLFETGIGAVGCVLGSVSVGAEVAVLAGGTALAAHASSTLTFIEQNPVGGGGNSSYDHIPYDETTIHDIIPWDDPSRPPSPDWEWRPQGSNPGDDPGNWYNPKTNEWLNPDMSHPFPEGPHWDYGYRNMEGRGWRIYPDGRVEPK